MAGAKEQGSKGAKGGLGYGDRYTELRPGEKLFEELLREGEGVRVTKHEHTEYAWTAVMREVKAFAHHWRAALERTVPREAEEEGNWVLVSG